MLERLARSNAPAAVVLVRIAVGWIFLSEGIQKFLYPDLLGAGRFARIGIPAPQLTGPFVGGVEIACGTLVLVGLLTRAAALVLLVNISVAILSTKIPILLGHGYWIFSLPRVPRYGFWGMSSEIRTDLAMLLGTSFLVIVGSGPASVDHFLARTAGRGLR
jgi:putative oxidoreductase